MLELTFVLDDKFLATYVINNYTPNRFIPGVMDKYKQHIVEFQNTAFEKSKDIAYLIDGRLSIYQFSIKNQFINYREIGSIVDKYISELITTKEFQLLKKQTNESISNIKEGWDKNFDDTYKYILNLGINVEGVFNIYITHPGLKAGSNVGNNSIIWSDQNYWPNYNTVYIWHEILHSYFEQGHKSHALIELITDEELRIRLNGGEYPPFVGHEFLNNIKTNNLQKWKDYLNSKSTDIEKLLASFN